MPKSNKVNESYVKYLSNNSYKINIEFTTIMKQISLVFILFNCLITLEWVLKTALFHKNHKQSTPSPIESTT